MSVLLVSHYVHAQHGAAIHADADRAGMPLELLALPADAEARLPETECQRVQAAFFSWDVYPKYSRQFFSTVRKAPQLQWLHVFNAGIDHPIYNEMLQRGVRVTTSSGSTAEPIAQTALAGMLWLARKFPQWQAAQRSHTWAPMRGRDAPRDVNEQTVLVVGLGHIGNEIARLAKALRMKVIGLRRSGPQPGDCVDAVHRVEELNALLPLSDWLVIACPLTAETRCLISAERLALLPAGAHVVNIARGEIVDEAALTAALQSAISRVRISTCSRRNRCPRPRRCGICRMSLSRRTTLRRRQAITGGYSTSFSTISAAGTAGRRCATKRHLERCEV